MILNKFRKCFYSTMRAVIVNGSKQMKIQNVEKATLKNSRDVIVKVEATSLNRGDIVQRKGFYPPPKGESTILGLEAAGYVSQVSDGCKKMREGDKVAGILPGGGYAEYAKVDERSLFRIPDDMDFVTAASIPEAWLTAYQLIHVLANGRDGENILIHAAGSGVGTAAVQLAKQAGMTVYATAGDAEKLERVQKLGADVTINYKERMFENEVHNHTKNHGVDVILDCVGGSYAQKNAKCLAMDARWLVYGFMGGMKCEPDLMLKLFAKRAALITTTLRNRSPKYKGDLVERFERDVLPHFTNGPFTPVTSRVYDWSDVNEAHAYMESNESFGKIVLEVK